MKRGDGGLEAIAAAVAVALLGCATPRGPAPDDAGIVPLPDDAGSDVFYDAGPGMPYDAGTAPMTYDAGTTPVFDAGTTPPPPPPPPPSIDACPAGGSLRVLLWDVYATPRKPDGRVWDGVTSGTIELVCAASADIIRRRVRDAAVAELGPGAGIADRLVGEAFEREVASLCGLVGNWLQMAYEGPDLTAFGAFDYDTVWQWQSRVVQDSWAARLNTNALGTPVGWEIPCDSLGFVAVLDVIDQDIAFDDPVGTLLMNLAIPDEIICDGWAYYEGVAGIAGVLVRLEVVGATPYCG